MSDINKNTGGFLVLDQSGMITCCDFRSMEILGYQKDALIGKSIESISFNKKLLVSRENHLGSDGAIEYSVVHLAVANPLEMEQKSKLSLDVQRYELVAKATNDVVWDLNLATNQIEWVCEGIYHLLGYEQELEDKLVLSDFLKLIHEEDIERVLQGQGALIRDKDALYWSDEFRMIKKDKQCTVVFAKGFVLRDANGKALHIVGVLRDLSATRETEIKLRELNRNAILQSEALAESNRELEQFAYSASHDLQEPLRMVISFLSKLEKKYEDVFDERGKQYLEFASDGAKRMRQIILDLLDFSRVGRSMENKEEVNMEGLVSEIKILLRKKIDAKKAIIHTDGLPVIHSYTSSMQLLFQNLIDNAIKFTKSGVVPEIRITCEENCDFWKFRIADNGIGIEEENFERIFQIFKQVHAKSEYPGSGIGLAVAKKIIQKMGGEIGLESTVGKGSVFYCTVPKLIYC